MGWGIKLPLKEQACRYSLVEVPKNLLIEDVFVEVSTRNEKYEFGLGLSIKDSPSTKRGTTTCFVCSGCIEDFKEQIGKFVSPKWIDRTLCKIIEKDIYETN